jgi:DNA-binding NtrC family response regulator
VQQSGGSIEVESEQSGGTTFRIYLPRLGARAEEIPELAHDESPRGSETVLIVEDEDMLRARMRSILDAHGYTTLEASNGLEAIEVTEQQHAPIDLLVTDLVMPGMGGVELTSHLIASHPDLEVLYVSGYTGSAGSAPELHGAEFLPKPFSSVELLRGVRRCLDHRNG